MSLEAWGDDPYGDGVAVVLVCEGCGFEREPDHPYEVYADEDGPTLQYLDQDAVCPSCGSRDFDWREA